MAATRSPLRIRPVPEMPSSPASRWSSGSSIPDSPLPRRRELPVVPEAAGASEVPAASCVPVTARSVVSLTYRSFPAVTCALPAQGFPDPWRSGPEAGTHEGTGRNNARRISGEERSSASAPREARPSERLRSELRRSSRPRQHRWLPACSSLSRRYPRVPIEHSSPSEVDLQRVDRPVRGRDLGDGLQVGGGDGRPLAGGPLPGEDEPAGTRSGDHRGQAPVAEPVDEGQRSGHRGGPLPLVPSVLGGRQQE